MRLLNTRTYELQNHHRAVKYAILSHRWCDAEITFETLNSKHLGDAAVSTPQLEKVRGACKQAMEDGLDWIWIDSCCINRSSSEELSTAINSMFQWYHQAEICYTYLSDVYMFDKKTNIFDSSCSPPSEWFSRGWTLQELLAPKKMIFFDADWNVIGERSDLSVPISRITGINFGYLNGQADFRTASIAMKLSWQANRKTERIEDMAYSLLGVLGVFLVPIYGEGREAFMRLQKELINTQPDESLFAWTALPDNFPKHSHSTQWTSDEWGLLAPSVDCFRDSGDIYIGKPFRKRPLGSITMTREGISFPITRKELKSRSDWAVFAHFIIPLVYLIIHYARRDEIRAFPVTLNCWRKDEKGVPRPVQIYLCRNGDGYEVWRRCMCFELGLDMDMYQGSSAQQTRQITILQPRGVIWPSQDEALR